MSNYSELVRNDFVKQLCLVLLSVFSAPVKTVSNQRMVHVTLSLRHSISYSLRDGTEAAISVYAVKCGLDLGLVLWLGFFQVIPLVTVLGSTGTSHHSSFLLRSQ